MSEQQELTIHETGIASIQRPSFWALADRYEATHELLADLDASLAMALSDEERAIVEGQKAEALELLDQVGRDLMAKTDALCGVIRRMESDVAFLKAEEDRLRTKRKATEAAIDGLKAYAVHTMTTIGPKELKTQTNTVRVQGNGGLAPLKVDEGKLDPMYQVITCKMTAEDFGEAAVMFPSIKQVAAEPDNGRIRKAITDGVAVEGAEIGERGKHLRIT